MGACKWLFRQLKTKVLEVTSGEFKPKFVMVDFEEAVIAAIRQKHPQTFNKGCYFHFVKAFFRKIAFL